MSLSSGGEHAQPAAPGVTFRAWDYLRVMSSKRPWRPAPGARRSLLLLCAAVLAATAAVAAQVALPAAPATVRIVVDASRVLSSFDPATAFGADLDGHGAGEIARILTPANIAAARDVGFGPRGYRLRSELGSEAWHWNPAGHWSDPSRARGYWTSSWHSSGPLPPVVYGYKLPRRGDTLDQANDAGFSRVDDGDPASFWKSNPYLDRRYTGEPNSAHAQWLFLDFGSPVAVDTASVLWGVPYATRWVVQTWAGRDAVNPGTDVSDRWVTLAPVFSSHGGRQTVRFPRTTVRFLRLLFLDGSRTAPAGSHDVRDRLGVAVRELSVGVTEGGRFKDLVRHAPNHHQTTVYVSSTDPWHRAVDRDPNLEQPSFDRFFGVALTRSPRALVPVAALYGTPSDAAAEVRFLRSRRYPVSGMEIGEEPDGQLITPEDYGALYRIFARALRRAAPGVRLGGPGYATSLPDWTSWPDARGERSFTRRFLAELGPARRQIFDFFSFEWYPFDDVCHDVRDNLLDAPGLLSTLLALQRSEGVGHTPVLITEFGWGAYAGRPEVDLPGALLDADTVGSFMSSAGDRQMFFYGTEPAPLMRESSCPSFGNLALYESDSAFHIVRALAAERALALVLHTWAPPQPGRDRVLLTSGNPVDDQGRALVTSYALARPRHGLAVLLINKAAVPLRVTLADSGGPGRELLRGPFLISSYGPREYVWHPGHGPNGYAAPNLPPLRRRATQPAVTLAPYSMAVVESAR